MYGIPQAVSRLAFGVYHASLGRQSQPQLSLFAPIRNESYRAQVRFLDGVAATESAGQEEQRFLGVRGQEGEVHDLREPGAGDAAEAGQVRVVAGAVAVDPAGAVG